LGYFIVYCICFCVVLIFKSLLVSIEGVRQTSAVLAAGQDSERKHEGYIGVWGLIRVWRRVGGLVNEICFC
jgi:hypothetical protein